MKFKNSATTSTGLTGCLVSSGFDCILLVWPIKLHRYTTPYGRSYSARKSLTRICNYIVINK